MSLRPITSRRTLILALLLCALVVLALSPAPPPADAAPNCKKVNDAAIVQEFRAKVKADHLYDNQWAHISMTSRGRTVTLIGMVGRPNAAAKLVEYAKGIQCVKKVRSGDLKQAPEGYDPDNPPMMTGCGRHQKDCGGVCIDEHEVCDILTPSL
jgi:hypothetical protein